MFLCCFPTLCRGSGQKKAQNKRYFCCCRIWRKCHHGHLSSSGRRRPQSSNEDVVEELVEAFTYAVNQCKGQECQARNTIQCQAENSNEDVIEEVAHGPHYTICRVRVQVHQANNSSQCWSEKSKEDTVEELIGGFNSSTSLDKGKVCEATDTIQCQTECAAELARNLREANRMRALQEGTLRKVAASMVPALPGGNISRTATFISIHPALSRAQEFLDLLFTRAIASTVGSWPDQVQGFGRALRFPWFQLKQASVQANFPAPHHADHNHLLWMELEHLEPTQAMLEGPPPGLQSTPEPEEGPAQVPAAGPARGPSLAWPGMKLHPKSSWRRLFEPYFFLS
ncbi:ral guanine nucleotide dissociation stimulator-like [Eptesicus fuscus]|uniref:ral guanine nucleotide dissociation stimulator-like n=1 Tax=Eptesicus fuscus TaxID=29078 RepID=UPI00240409B1|nr:ral guanine nucleotide dissociation stimulator-like [Eptesicus fuscus]